MEGAWILPRRLLCSGFVFVSLVVAPEGWARLGPQYQMALGNPDGASTNTTSRTKFLINQRAQYAISYNDDTHQPNWVSWSYSLDDDGTQGRTDAWQTEELLPAGYLKIGTASFGTTVNNGVTNSWDRGHMCPSADRTKDLTNNQVTFRMSNIIPQHANNNQNLWAKFEDYTRTLASGGNEVLIITGPAEFSGAKINNGMWIPGSVWKIAVVVPNASSTTPANQRLTTSARVIALLTPNIGYTNGLINDWKAYRTSVEQIEQVTGFNFFSEVDPAVATYLKNVVDTGTGPNAPTVITSFSPTFGPVGTTVTLSGYNFGSSPVVEFDGTAASSVTVVNANTLTAVVPTGATTGNITVTGTGGMDTSASEFTVTAGGTSPTFSLSNASLTGLTANEGAAGASRVYTVTGSYLTSAITVTAPTNFEVSLNNSFFSASVSLTPTAGALSGVPVYVRIKAGAPVGAISGNVTHVGGGATSQNLNVSGTVASTAPILTLSTTTLSGFTAVQGSAGTSKSYTISGSNLTGSVTVGAPTDFEISLSSSSGYASSLTLNPSAGSIPNTAVFVRIRSSAPLGSVSGAISHVGGGAADPGLAVTGNISDPSSAPVRIAAWDFTGESNVVTSTAEIFNANLDAGGTLTRGPNASASAGNNSFRTTGFQNDGISLTNSDYFEFSLSGAPGSTLSINSIAVRFDGTSTFFASPGATNQFAYSTNGTNFVLISTNHVVVTNTADPVTFDVSGISALQNLGGNITATFRFFASGRTATGGWGFNSPNPGSYGLDISGSVVVPAAPVITSTNSATATAYEAFSYTITATNSPTGFAASGLPAGLSLNSTNGVISGTPTTVGQYVVALTASNAGGDGTGTLTLTVNPNPNAPVIGGTLSATAQVGSAFDYQITASNSPTSYLEEGLPAGLSLHPTSGRITGTPTVAGTFAVTLTAINAVGSDTETLNLTIKNPSLTISIGQLTGFSANVGTASPSQTYTLSGADLSGAITVTAPLHFEISLDGSSYASTLSLNPDGLGSLSMPLLVRLAASAPVGIQSGSISHAGGGAMTSYLLLQGEAISITPVLLLSTNSLPAFSTTQGKPSIRQVYTVNGSSLSGNISISCPAGFELSLNDENYAATVTLNPVTGTLAEISIYVRLTGTTDGTFSGSLTHTGGGVASQLVAVTGQVTAAVGPPILSPLSGSVYTSGSFRHTIVAGGDTAVTYGATGLPGGWTVNTTNGLVSGTASSSAGTVTFTVSATNAEGTTTATYTLKMVSASEQNSVPLSVVINKMQYAVPDRIELLVVGNTSDAAAGPPVDLRGMILKDFASSSSLDTGGRFVFRQVPLWASVKAGTLIILATGKTLAEDLDPSDFVLRVNLGNLEYFESGGGTLDLEFNDMILLKAAGYGIEGIAGGIHALGIGLDGTQYTGFNGKKTRARRAFSSSRGYYGYVLNSGASLSDFSANNAADLATLKTFGTGSTTGNSTYISTLQATDQTGPTITLAGANPLTLALGTTFTDPGATATDTSGGSRPVTQGGVVDTAVAGSYTRSYTATDTLGNVSTMTRTVVVEKGTPVISMPPLASGLTEGQTLLASMLSGGGATYGGSAVTGAFTWSLPSTQPAVGTSSQLVTFTPADTSNYQVVTFSVNVIVAANPVQTWAGSYGLSGASAGASADPDGDGFNNAQEYAFGLNPTNASGSPAVLSQGSSQVKLTFLQKETGGITYAVKSASSLSGGFTNSVTPQEAADQTGVPTGYRRYEATLPTSTGRGFLKVEATLP